MLRAGYFKPKIPYPHNHKIRSLILFVPLDGTDILLFKIVDVSTAYVEFWLLLPNDNPKSHHWQQFLLENEYLVVDSVLNVLNTKPNTNSSVHQ